MINSTSSVGCERICNGCAWRHFTFSAFFAIPKSFMDGQCLSNDAWILASFWHDFKNVPNEFRMSSRVLEKISSEFVLNEWKVFVWRKNVYVRGEISFDWCKIEFKVLNMKISSELEWKKLKERSEKWTLWKYYLTFVYEKRKYWSFAVCCIVESMKLFLLFVEFTTDIAIFLKKYSNWECVLIT